MKHILVINNFVRDDYAADFDRAIIRSFDDTGARVRIVRMDSLETVGNTDAYSHLVLSGSEASAIDDHPWNETLAAFIRDWVFSKRPLLGICYGHQFLAKTLAGPDHIRRSPTPEFGWTEIRPSGCPFLAGPVAAMVSHYDEVINLPNEFQVLAQSDNCAVHAFQYLDMPVFGVQFHPEYGPREADFIFTEVARLDPDARQWFIGDSPDQLPDACKSVFTRFVELN